MTESFLSASWEHLIMANYETDPRVLEPYLPKGVELDYHNNKTYVSLVGFMFKNTRIFNIPIPFFGTFEEINLRFYVKRVEGDSIKRGVVFINETVPYTFVVWLANKLYKEHYIAIPTKNEIEIGDSVKNIKYEWKLNKGWNHIWVEAVKGQSAMLAGSIEEFIFEHYYGYTKLNHKTALEYRVNHARWFVNKVVDYSIDCDFRLMYGNDFSWLNDAKPNSVLLAEGSPVSVKWKRTQF